MDIPVILTTTSVIILYTHSTVKSAFFLIFIPLIMVNKILFYELIFVVILILIRLSAVIIKIKKRDKRMRLVNDKNANDPENPFEGLRNMAFDISLQQLGLDIKDSEIYGVIMDRETGNANVTLVAYKTGDASLYFSSGGGIIGGGQKHTVNSAAKILVKQASVYFDKSKIMYAVPLPDKDCIRFYFLTAKGKYCIHEEMKNIRNNTSPYVDFFEKANDLITEIRKTEEKEEYKIPVF